MRDPRALPEETFEPIRRRKDSFFKIARCNGKRSYMSKAFATQVAKDQIARKAADILNVYRCPFGDHWHLTHKSTL